MPGRSGGETKMTRNQRPEVVRENQNGSIRKKEERAVREAYKRERKIDSYLADDDNFPGFATQLAKMGLQLRDIPGDGNCLFRALGDQLEGHSRNHFRHRQDVVHYMIEHRNDFEPFMEDDVPFDTHIQNLKKLGTYAGNDAIVAFARHHLVNVVIHQLNAKHLMIQGCPNPKVRQLHISYHNGDHYSSVRKIHDNTESPSNIRLQDDTVEKETKDKHYTQMNGYAEKGGGVARAVRGMETIEEEVMNATQCNDIQKVRETLVECDYDVDAAITYLLQLLEISGKAEGVDDTVSLTSQRTSTDSGVWSDGGTSSRVFGATSINGTSSSRKGQRVHFREDSFGGSSGYGSMNSNRGGARPKLAVHVPQHPQYSMKRTKEIKKMEKKRRAEERHKQKVVGYRPQLPSDDEGSVITVISKGSSITRI